MRLWLRYLHEKRQIVLLYFVTAFLFITIGSLYHFENLEKLLYAALLTFAGAGGWKKRQGILSSPGSFFQGNTGKRGKTETERLSLARRTMGRHS